MRWLFNLFQMAEWSPNTWFNPWIYYYCYCLWWQNELFAGCWREYRRTIIRQYFMVWCLARWIRVHNRHRFWGGIRVHVLLCVRVGFRKFHFINAMSTHVVLIFSCAMCHVCVCECARFSFIHLPICYWQCTEKSSEIVTFEIPHIATI